MIRGAGLFSIVSRHAEFLCLTKTPETLKVKARESQQNNKITLPLPVHLSTLQHQAGCLFIPWGSSPNSRSLCQLLKIQSRPKIRMCGNLPLLTTAFKLMNNSFYCWLPSNSSHFFRIISQERLFNHIRLIVSNLNTF